MTATFGDFLRPAGEHIAAAVSIRDELPAQAAFGAICQFGGLLSTLVHYLADLPVPDEFSAAMAAELLSPEVQTVLDTRIALRRGAQSLRYAMNTLADAVIDDSHPAVQHLSAAAGFLAAGRDLLQTHFATSPGGTREHSSYWAPVITSPPVTAALLGEIARCTLRLAPWTVRLSMPEATAGDVPAGTGLAVLTVSHCTWVAGAAVQAAHRRHPPSADARRLLYAIPANFPPPRVEPSGHEQVSALSHGAIVSAERLRQAALAFARRARWSPTATSGSWRKDALAAAIIGHASEVILRGLTERARQLTLGPAICAQVHSAADATSQAWPTWRAIVHHWDIASTGIHRGAGFTPVAAEFGDLVLRIGRLAYHNQHWTPARAHAGQTRSPADLASASGDITSVVAAVHAAADAVTRIAAEDREAVRAAAANHRLYVPSFTRTNAAVVRRRYRPASPFRIDETLASYDDAIEASARATGKLDDLALGLDAPTWPLAALRGRPQRVLHAFRPGETPAPKGSPVRPPAIAAAEDRQEPPRTAPLLARHSATGGQPPAAASTAIH
jgi:hypothetical protein